MKLSVVIPCYNEENTLAACVARVLAIADDSLDVEVVIVDDCSQDESRRVAAELAGRHPEIKVVHHARNQGKGAALRTGFRKATGDVVAVQDADLEYDPRDLRRLVEPIRRGEADVVLGSRFLPAPRPVYSYWHAQGNRLLTWFSNMWTDLALTDMETCYKVFRREVIQSIELREDRFGFEPEIVAEIAHRRLRVYEMPITYARRSYEEGKKIGVRDGFRALYCILRYNAYRAPWPLQLLLYAVLFTAFATVDLGMFSFLRLLDSHWLTAAGVAFAAAWTIDYPLSTGLLFRKAAARGEHGSDLLRYWCMAIPGFALDLAALRLCMPLGLGMGKRLGVACLFVYNFLVRRQVIFVEPASPVRAGDVSG